MIKPVILSLAAATALAACSASEKQESPNLGAANSASEFCVKQGGKSGNQKKTKTVANTACATCLTVKSLKNGNISVSTTNNCSIIEKAV